MLRRIAVYCSFLLVLVAATFGAAAVAPSVAATPVRIMPLGDSITAGTGCWRAMLWNRLQTNGYTNIDFVGGVSDGGGCNPGYSYDFDHEGHGGYSATGIADQNQLPAWLNVAMPDIVLVHLGTNDMWGGYIPLATKLTAFTKLVGQMRANNPNVKILVAQIIPMSAAACATCPADVVAFNNALPGWAAGLTTVQSPIVVVDLWTGFDAVADNNDGVHPNTAGYQKMANSWYPALARVLDGGTPTTTTTTTRPTTTTTTTTTTTRPTTTTTTTTRPTTTTTTTRPTTTTTTTTRPTTTTTRPTTTTTTTTTTRPTTTTTVTRPTTTTTAPTTAVPTGTTGCSATYKVISQWGGGFQGEVVVTNTSTTQTSAWTTTFTFAQGQQVTQTWNATLTQAGASVTARNVSYNGSLAPGASATYGFLAGWNNQTNGIPGITCTLG